MMCESPSITHARDAQKSRQENSLSPVAPFPRIARYHENVSLFGAHDCGGRRFRGRARSAFSGSGYFKELSSLIRGLKTLDAVYYGTPEEAI